MDDLSGRTALVTGATSDIGSAVARALARRGADLALHGNTNVAQLESLRDELAQLGGARRSFRRISRNMRRCSAWRARRSRSRRSTS